MVIAALFAVQGRIVTSMLIAVWQHYKSKRCLYRAWNIQKVRYTVERYFLYPCRKEGFRTIKNLLERLWVQADQIQHIVVAALRLQGRERYIKGPVSKLSLHQSVVLTLR
jgi:hypothetical protein